MLQTYLEKCAWFTVVISGFVIAGLLIGKSYNEWQKSPFSTTITTHPIEKLDFPTVTVCPPRGSNTALNHDLMQADNDSLTDNDRKNSNNAAYQIFMEPFHLEYNHNMLAAVNPRNVKKMFDGLQSTPKPYGGSGFEILMWDDNGTIETPWYGQPFDETHYKIDKHHQMVLEFPEDLAEQIGSGFLVIEIEVDTRDRKKVGLSMLSIRRVQDLSCSKTMMDLHGTKGRSFVKTKLVVI